MVLYSACVIRLASHNGCCFQCFAISSFKFQRSDDSLFCQFSRPVFSILLKIGELKTGI